MSNDEDITTEIQKAMQFMLEELVPVESMNDVEDTDGINTCVREMRMDLVVARGLYKMKTSLSPSGPLRLPTATYSSSITDIWFVGFATVDKNPYSTRGLDKFCKLLAELDERRKKVYSKMNPHDISFVFAYSDNDNFVPIVVKVKNKDQNQKKNSKRDDQEDEKLKV
ncbi:hypothetical protein Ahy_A06g029930 [Arachis hypogaea]|uniref:Uncharacterized protein n=1 Tax=Arachis hypogaea TaxID=3818 RepID=A0A445CUM2_ARAHY|nr:hypothetical protein Ahy_A06g029930 [Arachis hypogaea]